MPEMKISMKVGHYAKVINAATMMREDLDRMSADELKAAVVSLEQRAAFGDQCWQDHCENAHVEQTVVKRLKAEFQEQLEAERWARQSAESAVARIGKVAAEEFGRIAALAAAATPEAPR